MALGAGGVIAVQAAAGLGLAAYAVATDDDHATTMDPPVARELDAPPPWPVGTCLDEGRPAPCSEGHDAEVVAVTDPGDLTTEDVRRWTADALCARTVTALATDLRPALFTYASLYPSGEVSRRDDRVTCLLVAPRRVPLVGSLTAGDLRPPSPPLPFE